MSTVTAYLRVSTDRQTLENQRSEISRFALSHRMKIDSWVEEIISGKVKDKDRKLGLLLKRLKKGDVLINSKVILFAFGLAAEIEMLKQYEEQILKDYASGARITHLSKAYGVSRDTMSRFVKSPR